MKFKSVVLKRCKCRGLKWNCEICRETGYIRILSSQAVFMKKGIPYKNVDADKVPNVLAVLEVGFK